MGNQKHSFDERFLIAVRKAEPNEESEYYENYDAR